SPHAPKSALQQFAAVLPSRAEVNPPTLRCCSPLTHRSQPSNTPLLFSPHALKPAFTTSLLFSPHPPNSTLHHRAAVHTSRPTSLCPTVSLTHSVPPLPAPADITPLPLPSCPPPPN